MHLGYSGTVKCSFVVIGSLQASREVWAGERQCYLQPLPSLVMAHGCRLSLLAYLYGPLHVGCRIMQSYNSYTLAVMSYNML